MVETALVYIHRIRPAKGFIGCGAVLVGDYIATCRHVWRDATAGFADGTDGEPTVEIEYPDCWRDGARETSAAVLADPCRAGSDGPEPDLVLLRPAGLPAKASRLTPASLERYETGAGYALAGLPGRDATDPLAVQLVTVPGEVPVALLAGRRQFTGANAAGYWTDRGSSGSPVFIGTGEQLAGIISLSETGRRSGESPVHEAFVVPGTIIRHHLTAYENVRRVADRENVPAAQLQPILDAIGAGGTPAGQMAERLRAFVEGARAQGSEPVPASNDGADIDAAPVAARRRLRDLDPDGARDLLQARIAEEEQTRRRRLLPLLRERASIERLAFDHEAAKATLAEITRLDPDAIWDWIGLGDLWVTTGSLSAAMEAYGKAEAAARRRGEERNVSVSHNRIGDVKRAQGDLPGALAAYTDAMAIAERLAARDPANSEWQRDMWVSHVNIGGVKVAQGDLPGALAAYTDAMAIAERLAARDPANSEWQRDLSVGHNRIGDVKVARGDLPGALAAFTDAMAIAERLAARDPANSEWQRDLSVSHNKIGDLKVAQGDLRGALAAYTDAMAIRERLAARDPANSEWQRDLSVSHNRIGDVKVAQGDLPGVLAAYTDAMAIAERLAARDPANSLWQRDLSVSHNKLGDVKLAQGDLPGALAAYTAAIAIAERLAAHDPANSLWQRDLSVSHERIGDVKVAQGDLPGALVAYTDAMAIRERLARDPANSQWQRDLSVSHNRIGDVELAQGDLRGALAAYTDDKAIAARLAARDPANSEWQRDLSVSHNRIGDVKLAQGDLPGALAAYTDAMAIRERLAARDPANTEWQRDLIVSCMKLADTVPDRARASLTRALEIARGLANTGRLAPRDAWIPDALERRIAALPGG